MTHDLVTIEQYDNPHRADMAKLRLESEDIPVYLENRLIVETDWLLSNAIGNIRLQVRAEDEQRARSLLATLRSQSASANESPTESDQLICLNCGQAMSEDEKVCKKCGWTYAEE